jgi:hypothetical protein
MMWARMRVSLLILATALVSASVQYAIACNQGMNNTYKLSSHYCNPQYGWCQYSTDQCEQDGCNGSTGYCNGYLWFCVGERYCGFFHGCGFIDCY